MSTVLNALLELGCTASLAGDDPQTAAEYTARVTIHTGTPPNWTTIKAKRAELATAALIGAFRQAIQGHIDTTAQTRSYDSGVTCASYVGSSVPAWAAEAQAFTAWRDAVWAHAYSELAKVQSGERAQPSVAEIIGELPAISWPA